MKSMKINRPLQSRYQVIWDVSTVLKLLSSWDNNLISLRLLGWKTVTLTAIAGASRGCEVVSFQTNRLQVVEDKAVFFFDKPGKTQKHKVAEPLIFPAFTSDQSICPVAAITAYLSKTESLRDSSLNPNRKKDSQFFISSLKPHNSVGKSTLANWVKQVLRISGVDISKFKCHSVRSASTSKAHAQGAPLETILKRGNWSSRHTWHRFYNRDIQGPEGRFQDAVFGSGRFE